MTTTKCCRLTEKSVARLTEETTITIYMLCETQAEILFVWFFFGLFVCLTSRSRILYGNTTISGKGLYLEFNVYAWRLWSGKSLKLCHTYLYINTGPRFSAFILRTAPILLPFTTSQGALRTCSNQSSLIITALMASTHISIDKSY